MTCKNFLLFKKGSSLLLTYFSCVNSTAVSWPVPSRLRPGWPVAPRQAARAPRSGAGARTVPSALRSGPSSRDAIPAPPGPPGTRCPAGQGAGPGAASLGAAPAPGVRTPPPQGGRNSCAQPVGLRLPSPALGLQELVLKHPPGLKPRGPSARRPSRAWENVAVHGTRHREPSPPPRGPRGALGPLPPAWLHPQDA